MNDTITCIMPTYNRVTQGNRCVDEAVECFLRQDYPRAELVIVNDCPAQTIRYAHPRVTVINLSAQTESLAAACNLAARAGAGDLITLWTDDDIRLPWALSAAHAGLAAGGLDYVTFLPHFYSVGGEIVALVRSAVYQTALFTRGLFETLDGYRYNQEHDADFDGRARRHLGEGSARVDVGPGGAFLVYRWGDGNFHLSGQLPSHPGDAGQLAANRGRPVEAGVFDLRPHWQRDYIGDAARAVATYS